MSEYKINIPRLKISKRRHGTPVQFLRKETVYNAETKGLLTPENREEYLQRIDHEIAVFERCGYVDYLLGVSRLTVEMSLLEIPYIVGRGVCAASLVFYCLGITNIDPIKHDLMFARFMPEDNPKFIELVLLVGHIHHRHIEDIQQFAMEHNEPEGHCVTLVKSSVVQLIEQTRAEVGFHHQLNTFDLGNACFVNVNYDETDVYQSICNGDSAGVYCLGRRYLAYLKPTSFDDLMRMCVIAHTGIWSEVESLEQVKHPFFFQEEIMRDAIACGFSEAEADGLRRAVGKKQTDKMELYRPRWEARYGEASWQTMTERGLWSYSKAHAVVLAYLAYTTAYLKIHFPEEFTRAALRVAVSEDY